MSHMKIYINTSPLTSGHAGRGIGQYTRLLVQAIKQYTDITLVESEHIADVTHHPFFDLFFLTLPFIKSTPTLVTIHDVIPLVYPEAYPPGLRGTAKLWIQKNNLASVQHVVTDSDCSTKDVVHYLSQQPRKVSTVYLAADPTFAPASKQSIDKVMQMYHLTSPYFLYVGDINYNKNLPGLLKAFSTIQDRALLVIVSKTLRRNNPAAAALFSLIDVLGIEDRLRILNNVPNQPTDEMSALYSGAHFYIQPSLYEGFGLPVLEAQACEIPVISSSGGSLLEICGDSTWTFNPQNQSEFEDVLSKSLSVSAQERTKIVEKGNSNHQRFDWQKTAKAMMELYQQCAR